MANMISWFEIPVHDMERAKQFYETVMVWEIKIEAFGAFRMGLLPATDDESVSGALVQLAERYIPSDKAGPLLYLNAGPDLQLVQDRVSKAGGQILIEKRAIGPGRGFMALILDSEGNRIALHSTQ